MILNHLEKISKNLQKGHHVLVNVLSQQNFNYYINNKDMTSFLLSLLQPYLLARQ